MRKNEEHDSLVIESWNFELKGPGVPSFVPLWNPRF